MKDSIISEKSEVSPQIDDEFDENDGSSSDENREENEEMDLIEIADVEKYVSRRLSKRVQEDQKDYELSPKVNKLLGKFYTEPRDFTEIEEQKLHLISTEGFEKNQENDEMMKKENVKSENMKQKIKPARRNSVNY